MKKLILIILSFCFYLPVLHAVQINQSTSPDAVQNKSSMYKEVDASHQQEANDKIMQLYQSFGERTSPRKRKTYRYPQYFGGAYIKRDGTLVVQIVGDMESGKKSILDIIGNSNIEFESVTYSYAYLESLMDDISLFVTDKRETLKVLESYSSSSLNVMSNSVGVTIVDLDEEKLSALKNTPFNNPAIILKKGKPAIDERRIKPSTITPVAEKAKSLYILNLRPFKFVKLEISPQKYSIANSTKGKIKMFSNSKETSLYTGNYVYLEKWENGAWTPYNRKEVSVEDIAIRLNKVESLEQEFTLDKYLLREDMKAGKYRILKSFSMKSLKNTNILLYSNFWIED